ncbi:hypothetical protein SLEP1_g37189 [Rubroshorea leprosula]|uniref:Integrase zinc-binding domain-containing protein n=1 Tax=Rubroshorea leprosula TaxID=152421 RepID=A0AAV5KU44_9ROSI|nr:hypothetical protein SLEP1_g37189 [Rubroshorea leprosula]
MEMSKEAVLLVLKLNMPEEQFQIPTEVRQRHPLHNTLRREGPMESARTSKLEERTRVLEMAMGRILSHLIPDDPLIPLLNRGDQLVEIATCNSSALSNVVVPTKPRGSGKSNLEPSSSKHNDELMRKDVDLERQLKDIQKSIDELRSLRSRQQALDLDSASLNLSITTKPYQEGFKIPHLETYDGSSDSDEHLHTYQAIMKIQNVTDAMMCKVFLTTLKSTVRRWYHKLPRHSITSYPQLATLFSNKFVSEREIKRTATKLMQVHQKEGESLSDYMQRFNKATLDIDNVLDTICLSALLHGLKLGRFLDDLLENPPKSWNEVNDKFASSILLEDFQSSKRPTDYKRPEGEFDVMMPHADPFMAIVHIGNHNVNKVFIDMSSSLDILYWSYFQKMQLNSASLKKYEGPIYGFDNQPVFVEGVITLPIYMGTGPWFRMASGIGVLKGNQKIARACYQDTFKKVELAAVPKASPSQAEPIEPVETIPLNPDELKKTVKIKTKLTVEERTELLEFLKSNQDVFMWTTDEMLGIPTEFAVHKLSTDPTRKLVVQKCRLLGLDKQAAIDEEIHKGQALADFLLKCHPVAVEGITASHPVWALHRVADFTLIDDQLYKQAASMPLFRWLTPYEAEYTIREVHEGVCGTHIGGKILARKLLRHGYYWPTMVDDAQNYVKKCPTCQFNANDIHMPESTNKIVLHGFKARVLATHSNWVDELNKVLWSYRTMPNSATGETLFSLVYGAEAVILVEIGLSPNKPAWCNDSNSEQLLRESLNLVKEVKKRSRVKNMAYKGRVA